VQVATSLNRPKKLLLAVVMVVVVAASLVAGYAYYLQSTRVRLRVYAASSLTNMFREYKLSFESQNNVEIILNLASSNTLREQIIGGQVCDVFASASVSEMDLLRNKGLTFQNRSRTFAYNSLVIATPADNPAKLNGLEDLVKKGVRIVVADFKTPLGNYTNQVLSKIESSWGDLNSKYYQKPEIEKYKSKILKNVIAYESNAQQVVTKVMNGLADAGFVYLSDVAVKGIGLQGISIPPEFNVKASYQIAVLTNSPQLNIALAFVDYVFSEEGMQIIQKWGFIKVEPP
jgi:molybdate transport system substrate-binding protein